MKILKNYLSKLFEDERSQHHISAAISDLSITKEEVNQAIKLTKNGKVNGPDDVSIEILKLLGKMTG